MVPKVTLDPTAFSPMGGILLTLGIIVGLVAIGFRTAVGDTNNIGLISDRQTCALASLGLIIMASAAGIMSRLELIAHRLKHRWAQPAFPKRDEVE